MILKAPPRKKTAVKPTASPALVATSMREKSASMTWKASGNSMERNVAIGIGISYLSKNLD